MSLIRITGAIPAKQSGHHDLHDSSAGTWRWCAGGALGHRGWRRLGAGHGLFAPHGPAPGARHFAFHLVAADWSRRPARILEAGPGGVECRDFLRAGNAIRRLCRELDGPPHAIPELERIVRLLPHADGISAQKKAQLEGRAIGRVEGKAVAK